MTQGILCRVTIAALAVVEVKESKFSGLDNGQYCTERRMVLPGPHS